MSAEDRSDERRGDIATVSSPLPCDDFLCGEVSPLNIMPGLCSVLLGPLERRGEISPWGAGALLKLERRGEMAPSPRGEEGDERSRGEDTRSRSRSRSRSRGEETTDDAWNRGDRKLRGDRRGNSSGLLAAPVLLAPPDEDGEGIDTFFSKLAVPREPSLAWFMAATATRFDGLSGDEDGDAVSGAGIRASTRASVRIDVALRPARGLASGPTGLGGKQHQGMCTRT